MINMKYILNEKYILTEANSIEDTKKELQQALINNGYDNKNLDSILATLNQEYNGNKNIQSEFFAKANKISNQIKSGDISLDKITPLVTDYISYCKNTFQADKYQNIKNALNKLANINKKIVTTDSEKITKAAKLISKTNTLTDIIKDSLKAQDTIQLQIENIVQNINDLKATKNKFLELVKTNTNTSSEILITLLNKIITDLPDLNNVSLDSKTDINVFVQELKSFNSKLIAAVENFKKLDILKTTENTPTENTPNIAKRDWSTLLNDAAKNGEVKLEVKDSNGVLKIKSLNIRELWDLYYEEEWGNLAKQIKDLGSPFQDECLNLGFSANINYFIPFLQKNMALFNITYNPYTGLHNYAVYNSNKLKADFNNNQSIAYIKNLYTKSGKEIENYFKLRDDILALLEYASFNPDIATIITQKYNNESDQLILDIFTGNPLANVLGSTNKSLHSIEEINTMIDSIFQHAKDVTNRDEDNKYRAYKDTKQKAYSTTIFDTLVTDKKTAEKYINLILVAWGNKITSADKKEILIDYHIDPANQFRVDETDSPIQILSKLPIEKEYPSIIAKIAELGKLV